MRVVLVGSGSAAELADFSRRLELARWQVTLVSDPTLRAFQAAGLVRSRARVLGPKSIVQELAAIARGYWKRRRAGDAAQLGGALLLDGDQVIYRHRSLSPGDLADMSDIIETALARTVERSAAGRLV